MLAEIIAKLIENYGQSALVSSINWIFDHVPPWLPMVIIFPILLTWAIVGLFTHMSKRK